MKIMVARIPLLLLCLASLTTGGWAQSTTFSLEDAIEYALDNNITIQNAQLSVADADAQISERLSTGLPQINGNFGFTHYLQVPKQPLPEAFVEFIRQGAPPGTEIETEASFFLQNNFTAGINMTTSIFDASYLISVAAARAAKDYAQLELRNQEREVRLQVTDAYLPVLLLEANRQQLEKNITNLEKLLQETKATFEAGFVEQLDVDRLELSLANLRTERDNLVRQQETALRALKYTLNYPLEDPLQVADNLDSMRLDAQLIDIGGDIPYDRRPELALLDKAIELNEFQLRVNRSAYLPTLNGNAGYQYQYQGNDFSTGFWAPTATVGLTLSVPIFDGFGRKARVDRAEIALETVRNQRKDLRNVIELEVRNARTNYQNASERLNNQERNLRLAERIYETTQIKYREGVGSSLEVTQAEQSVYEAQTNYLTAVYDLLVARVDLEQALGR
jgi:outer membrane protein TolC